MTAAAPAIKSGRPVIAIGEQDDIDLSAGLLRLSIGESIDGLYRSEALIGNWGTKNGKTDFLYFDRQKLDFGKPIQFKSGNDVLFKGRISALEATFPEGRPPELAILAEDRLQDLRMTRRTRTFADASDADVARHIATEYGLQAQIDLPGPTYRVISQVNQSDLAFLRERARAVDGEVWAEDSQLHVQNRSHRNSGNTLMKFGSELREFTVTADLAGQRTSVFVNGWDVAAKKALQHESSDDVLGGELDSGVSGTSILRSAFGVRKESIAHLAPLSGEETTAQAEAYYKRIARRFVVGRGVADVNAAVRVGAFADLQGLGPLFSGKYYISHVQHSFDGESGFRTEFTAERPWLGKGNQ